jgi:hypothetical protein
MMPAAPTMNLEAALVYADHFQVPVFPVVVTGGRKVPATPHGYKDASRDPGQITSWWTQRPTALVATPTGAVTGLVVLDIDIKNGVHGWDALEELGALPLPETAHAHTPSGGCHVYFKAPSWSVRCSAGKLGRGLDVRGDGGSIILPAPAGGYWWDTHLALGTLPLSPMPDWLADAVALPIVAPIEAAPPAYEVPGLSRYGRGALDGAGKDIIAAPAGQQETTLNGRAYWIGQLVTSGEIPRDLAKDVLIYAASQMPNYTPNNRWLIADITKKIADSLDAGMKRPASPRKELRHA